MTFSLLVIKTILQGGTRKLLNTMFSIGAVVVDMEAAITENLIWQTFTWLSVENAILTSFRH